MFAWEWYHDLPPNSWVKFVIMDRSDYDRAKEVMAAPDAIFDPQEPTLWAMSPCSPLEPNTLFQWMMEDQLTNVHFNLQIHKAGKLNE